MTLAAGSKLGPYEILSAIGAGGMGEVYKAKDPRLGREVAIKVLPASFSQDADRLRRFEQEAKAAGVLNHPNITAVYDIGTHDDAPYVVQELLEGETLRAVLSGGRVPPRKAIDYALQIAHGLSAAHEKGIVHRDLKPENLFVTKDGRLKILDFGLAKLTHQEEGNQATNFPTATAGTEPGVVMGTLGYMSPEQVRGKPADPRSDIFSFGAILYEMLSGKRAFHGDSAADTMSAILREDPPDLSVTNQSISPGLERIVRHCLEKNPEQRFHSAHDVAFALDALSGTSATSAAAGAISPKIERRSLKSLALAVGLVALPLASYLLGKRGAGAAAGPPPSYRQLTYRHGTITTARFAPDGQTVAFSAAWDGGPLQIYTTRLEFPESRPLGFSNAALLAISSQGELALILGGQPESHGMVLGTLSRAALSGGAPREILEDAHAADWGPGGQGLAVAHLSGGKDRLEFPVGKVLYETPGWIGHPRISPKGDLIAFFDHPVWPDDRGTLAVVDLGGKKRTLSTGWETEEGLAWSPDGKEVWFTVASTGVARDLYGVDLAGRLRLIARVPGGMQLQDIFRDGLALMTRNDDRLSILCQPPGETKERDLSWLEWSLPTDLSDDGKTLLFCEQGAVGGANYTACLRKTDGSPVVRLGEGFPSEFSPDEKWVLSLVPSSPEKLMLLPTGPGEARQIERGPIQNYVGASFFPDGKRLLVCGKETGDAGLYVQDISGGKPRRIGNGRFTFLHPISPNGKTIAAYDEKRRIVLLPADGGSSHPLPGFIDGEALVRWADDGSLFISHGEATIDIFRVDVASGKRTLWKHLAPPDPAGVSGLGPIVMTADGKTYAYGANRTLSDLYLADGLR